MDEYVNNKI